MKNTSWNYEDLEKLKRNSKRPITELKAILKNRYTEEDIRNTRSQILNDLNSKSKRRSGARCAFPEDTFKILYDNSNLPFSSLMSKYPELKKHQEKTLRTYFSYIRRELKGIHTKLPESLYELMKSWYNCAHADKLPERGSTEISDHVKDAAIKTLNKKPLQISVTTKANVLERISSNFTSKAKLKIGIFVNEELKFIVDSEDQAEGALLVYKNLGCTSCKKFRILMEEI